MEAATRAARQPLVAIDIPVQIVSTNVDLPTPIGPATTLFHVASSLRDEEATYVSLGEPDLRGMTDYVAHVRIRSRSSTWTTKPAVCPVLIHSTNAPAADSMMFSMRDAGWTVDRIAPIGDDWIEAYWYPVACRIAVAKTSPNTENGG